MAKRLMARVRELRRAMGLSQEAFAERAGLKYKHYQAMEAGRRLNFQFVTLQKLAKGFGLEPYELLNFEWDPGFVSENPPEKLPDPPARQRRKR
jgi:transcriptional regulator with XRE-family HTH domain